MPCGGGWHPAERCALAAVARLDPIAKPAGTLYRDVTWESGDEASVGRHHREGVVGDAVCHLDDPVVGGIAPGAAGELDAQRATGQLREARVRAAVEHQHDVVRRYADIALGRVAAPLGDGLDEARRSRGGIVPPPVRAGAHHVVGIDDPAHHDRLPFWRAGGRRRLWQAGRVAGDDEREGVLVVGARLRIPLDELVWRFSPSGGPGGQHANTSHTRAEVRFDIERSPSLDDAQRARLLRRFGPEVRVVSQRERSQARNRADALSRLATLLADGLRVERARRPTRATAGSVERRLDAKRRRSTTKFTRRRPGIED